MIFSSSLLAALRLFATIAFPAFLGCSVWKYGRISIEQHPYIKQNRPFRPRAETRLSVQASLVMSSSPEKQM